MKFLLTSAGVRNPSIHDALVDLLGKPIADSVALYIPTAVHPMTNGPTTARKLICGGSATPLAELGWKSVGVLELTALPSIKPELWRPWVQETDALLVAGGDPMYLAYWMRESGLLDLLPSLRPEAVYASISAGGMVAGPDFAAETYDGHTVRDGDHAGLGLVDFAVFPHLDYPEFPENTMAEAEKWAAARSAPTYAIDDDTAVRVIDGTAEVISEGHWKYFTP